ncbi:MAG TPA: type II toxin-antitoxin system RatA family toxin [Caulobacteraceae bacterium]
MRHRLTRELPYAPDQLFSLVGDVQAYPLFVPWITSMRVWNPREEAEGVDSVEAEASVGFAFLTERFSTRVRRDANSREIAVSLIRGPFRRLDNRWRFSPHPSGTLVEFSIDFEFKSRLLEALLAANLSRAVERLIGCFEDRAKALYGN